MVSRATCAAGVCCQVRLFLYCQLRMTGEFTGEGHTASKDGVRGPREYLFPNVLVDDVLAAGGCFIELGHECMNFPVALLEAASKLPHTARYRY